MARKDLVLYAYFNTCIDINEGRRMINFKLRITNIYIVSGWEA